MNEKAIKLYARKNFMAYLIIYLVSLLFDAQTLLQSNFMVSMQICTYMKYNNNPPNFVWSRCNANRIANSDYERNAHTNI